MEFLIIMFFELCDQQMSDIVSLLICYLFYIYMCNQNQLRNSYNLMHCNFSLFAFIIILYSYEKQHYWEMSLLNWQYWVRK